MKSDEKVIMPAFFHTTPQISQKLASMKCDGMSYEKVRDPSAMLFNPAAVELEVVKMAPHTAREVASSTWEHPYTRENAAYPSPEMEVRKFWSPVARVDNAYGDRNLVCSCPPLSAFEELLG